MATNILKGSERKFTIKMNPIDGVHLADCRVTVSAFIYANRVIPIESRYVSKEGEDAIKVVIPKEVAEALSGTEIKFRISIGIPDGDFPDNYKDQSYDIIPKQRR